MNFSYVECYFVDFLSVMEFGGMIRFYEQEIFDVLNIIGLFKNLFIIGIVNIDEIIYMFSFKVLDWVNVIEFCIEKDDMKCFL